MMTEVFDLAVANLPDSPKEPIVWIVYNEDHVEKTKELIDNIKGMGYCEKYCEVLPRQSVKKPTKPLYYDPRLLDHIGNGAN